MKKRLIITLLLLTLVISIAGCSKPAVTPPPENNINPQATNNQNKPQKNVISLKEMAAKEKEFLSVTTPIYDQENKFYAQFYDGKIDRTKLNDSLSALKPQVDKLRSDSREYYALNDVSPDDKKTELYNGLKVGNSMRSEVFDLIITPITGQTFIDPTKKDSQGQYVQTKKTYNDEELKEYIKKKQESYDKNLKKLNDALSKI